ncbi:MAG: ETC complex I subunit [Rhodospirillales bacterium]|nr:MAG: ETC complex I subunit [Rhodospirillales bacterium]
MTAVTIYRPAKTAMQSGRRNTRWWEMNFEPAGNRFVEPLMGWTGTTDTRGQVCLRFPSREAAVAYAERHGLSYRIRDAKPPPVRVKSYADNFAYQKLE